MEMKIVIYTSGGLPPNIRGGALVIYYTAIVLNQLRLKSTCIASSIQLTRMTSRPLHQVFGSLLADLVANSEGRFWLRWW